MIIVTIGFPDTHHPSNAIDRHPQPGTVRERLLQTRVKIAGVHTGTFLQLTFEPNSPGRFRGASDHLIRWLIELAKCQWGEIVKIEVKGTERNPLHAEIPNFD